MDRRPDGRTPAIAHTARPRISILYASRGKNWTNACYMFYAVDWSQNSSFEGQRVWTSWRLAER